MTTASSKANYRQRYEESDDGLRFQDLTYTGNFAGMEPVTDGIRDDKTLRARGGGAVDGVRQPQRRLRLRGGLHP